MKKNLILTSTLLTAAAFTAQAQTLWDGDTDSTWDTAANWAGDTLPTASDDVVFNVSTGLPAFGGVTVNTSAARNITVDIPAWAVRADTAGVAAKTLDFESMTFTSNFTNNAGAGQTFTNGGNADGLRLRISAVDSTMTNNSSNAVVFNTGGGTGFGIAQTGSGTNLLFNGSGDYIWDGGTVFAGVNRFGTGDSFTGTFNINGGTFNMGVDMRAQGGTITINGNDLIGDATNITLNDNSVAADATFNFAGVTDNVGSLNSFNNGGIVGVDALTNILFADYNAGTVAISGFVEGQTVLQFDSVSGTESLANMTINGVAASWSDIGGGIYQLSAVPEPGTYALLAGMLSLVWVMVRRRS